jgi:hypothetical protein
MKNPWDPRDPSKVRLVPLPKGKVAAICQGMRSPCRVTAFHPSENIAMFPYLWVIGARVTFF